MYNKNIKGLAATLVAYAALVASKSAAALRELSLATTGKGSLYQL